MIMMIIKYGFNCSLVSFFFMFKNTPHITKRFPTPCRYYAQGSCRAGQECVFSHVLPLQGKPSEIPHPVLLCPSDDMANSLQSAIRDLELDQLENKYRPFYKSTNITTLVTIIELVIPSNHPLLAHFFLFIPSDYPDAHCVLQLDSSLSLEIQSRVQQAFEDHAWHHNRHTTLVQQLDWLCTHHFSLFPA
ncbi:CCCH-type zinc finger transcription factor [Phycomyces blakesleeanus]